MMGKRLVLSEIETGKTFAYVKCGKSVPGISKLLKRTVGEMYKRLLKLRQNFNIKCNPCLSERDKRMILQSASQNGNSSKLICINLCLLISTIINRK